MQMIQINETDYVNVDRIILVRKVGDQWKIFMSDYMEFDIPDKYLKPLLKKLGFVHVMGTHKIKREKATRKPRINIDL